MAIRKDGVNQNLDEKTRDLSSSEYNRNDEDKLDTRDVSNEVEEADEEFDDEELEDDELTEEDFEVDEEDEEDEVE